MLHTSLMYALQCLSRLIGKVDANNNELNPFTKDYSVRVICVQCTKSVRVIRVVSTALLEYIALFIKIVKILPDTVIPVRSERCPDIGGPDV